jgi:hypothetical protein
MNRDGVKLLLLFLLIGLGVLFLASPLGDWVQGFIRPREQVPQTRVAPAPATPLPALRLKRDLFKTLSTTETKEEEEPKLPPTNTGMERHGTLTNDEIETALTQRQSAFQRCWTQRLKDLPGLSGNVLMQFEITGRGKVQNVMVAESTIRDDLMVRCLGSVLERLTFRSFDGGPISLTFPLSFE